MSAWGEAREAFQAALDREETPEALEGLGVATGWLGDARTSVAVRERAYHGYRRRGDDEAAARAAIGLALTDREVEVARVRRAGRGAR